jgi:hypothetical protein
MLRRIFTILAILAGIGVIVVTQLKLREHIQGIIDQREANAKDRDKERGRAVKAERTLNTTSNELVSTTAVFHSTSNELETTKGTLSQVRTDLEKVTADKQKALDSEKAARQELAQWIGLGIKPEQVRAMIDDLAKAKDANAALEEEKKIINRELKKTKAELEKLLDPDNYVVQLPVGLKGTVLVVDPKWEFVVLDIGEKQGVLKDGIMMVHRDSKLVGKVKIANVMGERSIANIMPGWKLPGDEIREGDKVLF